MIGLLVAGGVFTVMAAVCAPLVAWRIFRGVWAWWRAQTPLGRVSTVGWTITLLWITL